ncbi:GTPase-activating protein [Saccharomycopsis crataegensis]|uniref:GTPase-activating protein n=1 Tax=Saccharomycopsis crataegensis TaxID=43959 RepID=A0AAV5QJE4_9ASCO|nr:GTPase-activating protein [Saccharomycopsis crataegensis]
MVAGTSSLHANSFNLLAIDNNEVSGFHDDNHVKTGSSESQHYAKNNIGASKPQSSFLNIISQSPSGEKLGKLTRPDQLGNGGGLTNANPEWVNLEFTDIGKSVFLDYPLSKDRKDLKVSSIKTAITLNDLNLLINLSISREGLLSNELRSQAWPLFLGITNIDDAKLYTFAHENAPAHKDESQVLLDINRSFTNYPKDRTQLPSLRVNLELLIFKILRKYPNLSYYQGYHDIAQLILLVFNNNVDKSFMFLEKLTLMHLRDYMVPTINSSVNHLNLILLIIYNRDYNFFKILNNLKPYYSLSSIITLFTHDVGSYNDICYIFDFLLSSSASSGSVIYSAIYLYSEILLCNKSQILNLIFENIFSKISESTEDVLPSYTNSYISENDTLTDSILSNHSTAISEGTLNQGIDEAKYHKDLMASAETYTAVTESQYRNTSSLSGSDFIGYADSDIELINFDYLHNILSNLVSDFITNSRLTTENKSILLEVFKKTNELMKDSPIFTEILEIEGSKVFQKTTDAKSQLKISLSSYCVLKNTSKVIPGGRGTEGNHSFDHQSSSLLKNSERNCAKNNDLSLAAEIMNKQVEEALEEQRREREEQERQFKLMMKEKATKRNKLKQSKQTPMNYLNLILYPLNNNNSVVARFFKNHRFLKISFLVGVISVFLNIYLSENSEFKFFQGLYFPKNHNIQAMQNELYSLGKSSYFGIRTVLNSHNSFNINGVVDSLSHLSEKVFS